VTAPEEPAARPALTKDRIVRTAVDLADREGLQALTMRRLGAELGVEAMSLYKHVANKEQILEGIVDRVFGSIEVPGPEVAWPEAMRLRAHSARAVLRRHAWAIGLLEGNAAMGPASMRYVDSILGILRSAGFSPADAAHAFWTLDSFVYGHVLQETRLAAPDASGDVPGEASDHPNLATLAADSRRSGYSVDREFEFGLDLIVEALRRTVGGRASAADDRLARG
jgi:AcrR family transcriptional regulator